MASVVIPRRPVARRTVLGLLAAAGGVVAASPARADPRPSTGRRPRLGLSVVGVVPVVTFEPDWSVTRSFDLPLALRVDGWAGPRDVLTLTVTYDRRVVEVVPQGVAASDGMAWSTGATRVDAPAGDVGTLTVEVLRPAARAQDDELPVVLLPLRARHLYPAENIGAVAPLTVELSRAGRRERRAYVWKAPEQVTSGPVWGAHVSASFVETAGAYRAPAVVRVESVGPQPVPAGALVRVEVDHAVTGLTVASAEVDGVVVDLTGRLQPGLVTSVLEVPVPPLAAGSELTLQLEAAGAGSARGDSAAASVRVVVPPGTPGHVRATGAMLAADVTSSGASLHVADEG